MERLISRELGAWLVDPRRRPLVVRGARQVGKTWLIRELARRNARTLIEIDQVVVPVEVKAGASGSMKSLHQFMHDKGLGAALRVDTNAPSVMSVDVKTTTGQRSRYRLLSLPGYLLWRAGELMSTMLE